jgi:predicted PurR-regulated permease PerM
VTLTATPAARERSRRRWRDLADRIQSVSPQALGRGGIALAVTWLGVSLVAGTWPALAPFVIGAVIAYAVLPIANRLDRFMPRVLAALLAELVAVAVLVGVAVLVVPPLLQGLVQVALALPTADELQARLAELQAQLGTLPDPLGGIVTAVAIETSENLQATINGLVEGAGQFVTDQLLGIFGTASFVLGLLVIPAWILTLVSDERSIKRRGALLITPALRPDVAAYFRIVDRAMGTFLRARMLVAIVTAFLIWIGLVIVREAGIAEVRFAVPVAILLGALQLIPELGFFLGFFPLALALAIAGPVPAAIATAIYIVSVKAGSRLVEGRVARGVLDVHPGLMIPAIVVMSEFGLIWLFAAGPAVAILRDVVRYTAGRLGDPPAPANVLPGERVKRGRGATVAATVPSIYRDLATRRAAPATAPAQPVASQAMLSSSIVPAARTYAFTPATPKPSTTVTQRSPQS